MSDTLNGEAIRLIRGARGWPLRKLAAHVGISPGYLSKIENDGAGPDGPKPNVSPRIVAGLAGHLRVGIEAFSDPAALTDAIQAITRGMSEQDIDAAYWDARVHRPTGAVAR